MVHGSKKLMSDRNAIITAALSNNMNVTPNDMDSIITERSGNIMKIDNIMVDRRSSVNREASEDSTGSVSQSPMLPVTGAVGNKKNLKLANLERKFRRFESKKRYRPQLASI